MTTRRRAVVLLSGGMDSATCLAEAVGSGRDVHALTVVYGQRHVREIASARALVRHFRVRRHTVLRVPLDALVRSSLTDPTARLPQGRVRGDRIPSTYVPARNTVMLSLALAAAETDGAREIYIGANAIDYSGYPDCRPAFLAAFEAVARTGTKAGAHGGVRFHIRAPLLRLSKAQIVRRGRRWNVPWALTWSCYAGGPRPCGTCDSCRLRARGFHDAGILDPAL